ncbi:uncharacterized protein LOC130010392 [Patella vulgata]|uniref:uncharacterized protein LOC130010392 n=1 Tax=Patella vulgata TaxID=6465 RepID=UPI00217F7AAA|nr:uncharacterized protein LOC130010392 [Patella vulgata]
MKPYTLLFFLLYSDYGGQGFEWFKPGNNEYTSLSGCNIELIWNLLIKDHTTTITKVEKPGYGLNDDKRYVINTKETEQGQDLSMIIPHVTVPDSGVYRCTVDNIPRHKDINVTVTDFKWNSDKKSIEVQEGEDINLEWKYVTQAIFKHILVYRIPFEENSRKQCIGNLTADHIDNQGERHVGRTYVTLNKIKDGYSAILTLLNVTEDDVKYNYFIELVYSDTCSMIRGPTLLNKASKVYSETPVIKVRRHEDINFVWNYEYISPVVKVLFTRRTHENKIDKIGYWHEGEFESTMADGESRLIFNKTERNITNGSGGQITLTLRDAAREDFNYFYICRIIFHDKEESSWNILLEEQEDASLSTGEVAAIAVTVVVAVVILVITIVIVLSRRNELVRRKIQTFTGGNTHKTNQAESILLQENNRRSEYEATVDGVQQRLP